MEVPTKEALRETIALQEMRIEQLIRERNESIDRELDSVRAKLRKHHDLYRYASVPPQLCPECQGLLASP